MRLPAVLTLLTLVLAAVHGCSGKKTGDQPEPGGSIAGERVDGTDSIVTGRFVRYEDSAIAPSVFVCDSTEEVQRVICLLQAVAANPAAYVNRMVRVLCQDTTVVQQEDSVLMKTARSVAFLPEPGRRQALADRGLGIIGLADTGAEPEGYVFPAKAVDACESPAGRVIGQIVFADNEVEERTPHLRIRDSLVELAQQDIEEIDYETYALRYYADSAGFVLIASATRRPGVWLNTATLAGRGHAPRAWQDFLLGHACAHPIVLDTCISLRSSPADTAAAVTPMLGDGFQLRFTGEKQGPWLKATLEHNDGYCGGGTIYRTWQGWVRVVDDRGNPLVWFYPRGC